MDQEKKEFPPPYSAEPPQPIGFQQPNPQGPGVYPQPAYAPPQEMQQYPQAPQAPQPMTHYPPGTAPSVTVLQQPAMQPMLNTTQPMMITTSGGGGQCHGRGGGYSGPVVVTAAPIIGRESARMQCPHCSSDIDTSIKKDPTMIAYVSALALCFFGCFWGCCLIPLCMEDCKSVEHHCPSCKRFLGKYQKY